MIDIHVAQIMTEEVVTVARSQTLASAARTMEKEGIKSVVVSDENDRPEGILTSTDFVQMAATKRSPSAVTVDGFATDEIVTTTPDADVRDAADLLREHAISHLPVVDDDGRLTGIVTTTDVAAYVSGVDDLLDTG